MRTKEHFTPMADLKRWLALHPEWRDKVKISPLGKVLATEKAMDAYVRWLDEQKGEAAGD